MSVRAVDSFLPVAFRSFVYEVQRIERRIRTRPSAGVSAEKAQAEAAAYRNMLAGILRHQATEARLMGRDPDEADFQNAQYLMATVADKTFEDLDWPGSLYWRENPLAAQFPPPDGVDPEIETQIAEFLNQDRPDLELAQIYLLVLAMGPPVVHVEASLANQARQELFDILARGLPGLTHGSDRVFPDAYGRVPEPVAPTYLPRTRGWLVAFLVLTTLTIAVSFPLWRHATFVARDLVDQILQAIGGR